MILRRFAFSRHFSGDTCADQEHGSQLFPGQGAAGAEEDTRQKTVEEGWIFGWEGRWDSSSPQRKDMRLREHSLVAKISASGLGAWYDL